MRRELNTYVAVKLIDLGAFRLQKNNNNNYSVTNHGRIHYD